MGMLARKILASLGLLGFAGLHGWAMLHWGTGWDRVTSGVFSAGDLLAVVALWAGWFWARWYVQGIGVVGLLNCAALGLMARHVYWIGGEAVWIGIQAAAFLGLLVLMSGRSMRAAYDAKPSPLNTWNMARWEVRALRWALVLGVATLPMLFRYIGTSAHWMGDGERALTVATTLLLAGAVGLLLVQRSAGLLLMVLAGAGTAYLAVDAARGLVAQLQAPPPPNLCGFAYGEHLRMLVDTAMVGAALVPGAVAAVAVFAVFLRPMLRFLRG